MPGVSLEAIKDLREQTSAGVMDCKNALEEADGDMAKAVELLRQKGLSIAAKKSSRDTLEGVVDCYIHAGSRVGAIVELNCETDFVARTPEFKELAHNLAMQVAAMSPRYVDGEAAPEDESAGAEGMLLMEQDFIKDPSLTIRGRGERRDGRAWARTSASGVSRGSRWARTLLQANSPSLSAPLASLPTLLRSMAPTACPGTGSGCSWERAIPAYSGRSARRAVRAGVWVRSAGARRSACSRCRWPYRASSARKLP